MATIEIPATQRTPAVSFDFEADHLRISGESYPEDVVSFYGPLIEALNAYLDGSPPRRCRFEVSLLYFNSSSAKALMTLLERLDEAARDGARVDIDWFYDPDDETMRELGEEFGEDLQHAAFRLVEVGR